MVGVTQPRKRGPGRPRTISKDAVVQAALAAVTEAGLRDLTISRVAARLGVAPMALYRHVPSKQALLEAVTEAVVAQVDLWVDEAEPLQVVQVLARRLWAVFEHHPGTAEYFFVTGPTSPQAVALVERSLAALLEAGLAAPEAARVHVLVFAHVVQSCRSDMAGVGTRLDKHRQAFLERLRGLDPAAFPALAVAGPTLAELTGQDQFEYGLARLLYARGH